MCIDEVERRAVEISVTRIPCRIRSRIGDVLDVLRLPQKITFHLEFKLDRLSFICRGRKNNGQPALPVFLDEVDVCRTDAGGLHTHLFFKPLILELTKRLPDRERDRTDTIEARQHL